MADVKTEIRQDPAPGDDDGGVGRVEPLRPAQIFDPVARALDVIGDRWSLVLIRQLLTGPKGFQELRLRTGIAPRDNTIEVVRRVLTVELDGFGELFRMLSYQQVGSAAMLSRAVGALR